MIVFGVNRFVEIRCGALHDRRCIARPFPKALPASDCQGNNSATANQCNLSHHCGTCSWLPLASLSPCELCRIEKHVAPQAIWRTWEKHGRLEAIFFPNTASVYEWWDTVAGEGFSLEQPSQLEYSRPHISAEITAWPRVAMHHPWKAGPVCSAMAKQQTMPSRAVFKVQLPQQSSMNYPWIMHHSPHWIR